MKTIRLGEHGILTEYLQLALNRAGYPTTVDGIFGEDTCRALRDFLSNRELGCEVTEEIWERLVPYLKGYTRHTVVKGDTLYKLAGYYRTREERIFTANPKVDVNRLSIGMELVIPFDFPVVPTNVRYSSLLNEYIIEGLVARYPFLRSSSIGKSVMGRPLQQLSIGSGATQVFYNASFHANENITTPVLLKFAEEYADAFSQKERLYGADAQTLFARYELKLVPMVNPDGVDLVNGFLKEGPYYALAAEIAKNYPDIPFPSGWKANIEGVDLNLQFPAGWELARRTKYAQGYTMPAPRDFVGEKPLSAPESMAIYNFTRENDFRLVLAYHTQGEVIYWKYQDYNPKNSRQIAQYFSMVSGYAVEETPLASGYAGYKDWFIMAYNRPGYTIEAGLGKNPLPMNRFAQIYEDNKGILLGGMTQI